MKNDLPADLADLDAEIGYGIAAEITAYRDAMERCEGQEALLVTYSQLFLAPPRKVHLNTATYIDGAFNGGTVIELDNCYRANGLERNEEFLDLSDHIALQLEFIAHLFEEEATLSPGFFIALYPGRWIYPLQADIEQVEERLGLHPTPYRHLIDMLAKAVDHDADYPDQESVTPAQRRQRALSIERHKRAERAVSAEELKALREKLAEKGLSTEHLDPEAPAEGNPFKGWVPGVPPSPRK